MHLRQQYPDREKLRQFAQKINIDSALYCFDEPMSAHTSFAIGGPADLFVRPASEAALVSLVAAARAEGLSFFVLGGGANILVGDKGIRGLVLDMSGLQELHDKVFITTSGDSQHQIIETGIRAGAGLSVDALCMEYLARGLAGFEDFFGMPGSVGGAVFMNARCYEAEISERVASLRLLLPDGSVRDVPAETLTWGYKKSPLQPGEIFAHAILLSAVFKARAYQDGAALGSSMRARRADRDAKGHYRLPCAGSIFKNNREFGRPTGAILDELGFKGRRIDAACVSDWHANIFVNAGGARAADMRALIELAQSEALKAYGFALEPEVLYIGEFA